MTGGPRSRLAGLGSAVAQLHRGELAALLVVLGYLLFVGLSAATAPPVDVGAADNETHVGTQGGFREANGYATVLGPNGSTRWQSPEAWAHFDVDRLEDDRILAAYLERDRQDCGPYDAPCSRTGFRIYDRAQEDPVVREWTIPVRTHVNSEVHDATMLPNGNVVVADMEHERIVEVDESGEIVWQWNASSYYDAPPDPTREDWLHINDVDYLGDGRFMVSVRNAHQVLIINRDKEVVEVVNEDRDTSVMNEQHNPQYLGPDRILVADSGNDRVVELRKDDSGEWRVAWQLRRVGGVSLSWPRDIDLLANGNYLITDSFNNRVVEVTRSGTLVWSASTRPIPYEADRNGMEYPPSLSTVTDDGDGQSGGSLRSIPLLSGAYAGFAGTVGVPYWFQPSHFVGLVVTVLVGIVGLGSGALRRLR